MVTHVFPLFQRLVHQLDTDYIIGSECATEPSTFIPKDYTRISRIIPPSLACITLGQSANIK